MKTVLLLLALILSFSFSSNLFAEDIHWMTYEDARALHSDMPIFVFAKMRTCDVCAKMEKDEFTDPELVKLLNENFIPIKESINFAFSTFKFNDLKSKKGKPLKFRGFPSVMLVMGNNYSVSQGYKTAEQLKTELTKVIEYN